MRTQPAVTFHSNRLHTHGVAWRSPSTLGAAPRGAPLAQTDPLPSWNDGPAKTGDRRLRHRRDAGGGSGFRPAGRAHRHVRQRRHALVRAADLFPVAFALDRVKALAPQHPEWKDQAAIHGGARGRHEGAGRRRREGLLEFMAATHAGMTTDEFAQDRSTTGSPPHAIRASTGPTPSWSTSRCWNCWPICARTASRPSSSPAAASSSCGLGREGLWHSARAGRRLVRRRRSSRSAPTASPCCFRNRRSIHRRRPGKPVGINRYIGRRPIAAFGNSDGDQQMLQWTRGGRRRPLHGHRPPHRRRARIRLRPQVAYRPAGQGARRGEGQGWTMVDMKRDWRTVFPASD